jgi:hypothetical protein
MRTDSKTRIWAAYFCVIGLALGFFYIGLAWLYRKQEEPHAILLMVLTIPAFLFVSEGRKSDLEQYESEWDSFVAVIPTFALGVEFAMLLMGWILRLIHLSGCRTSWSVSSSLPPAFVRFIYGPSFC